MYNYPMAIHLNKKSNTTFYKQLPVFLCFFICLATFFFTFYFLNLVTITALLWLFILSSSVFILLMNRHWSMYLLIIAIPVTNIRFSFGQIQSKLQSVGTIQRCLVLPITFVVFFIVCVFLLERVRNKAQQRKGLFPAFHLPVLIICCWGIISEFWTPSRVLGIETGIIFITNIAIYLLISYYANSLEAIKKIMLCWIIMAVVVAISMFVSMIPADSFTENVALNNYMSITNSFEMRRMRATGFSSTFSISGTFVMIAVLFAAGLVSSTQNTKHNLLLFMAIVFLMFAFIFAQSKAQMLGLITGILFLTPFLITMEKSLIKYFCYIGVSFLIVFGIFSKIIGYLLQQTSEKGNVSSRFVSSAASEEAASLRFKFWNMVFKQVIHHDAYLSGLGIGGGTYYLFPIPHPHNVYISIVCDFGFIGFMVLIAIALFFCGDIFYIIKKLPIGSTRTLLLCIYASMIAVGVISLSDLNYSFTITWALLGLVAAAHKQIRNYTLVHNETVT